MKRILVIGGSGQLARSLAETPLPRGISLSFAGRPDCDIRDRVSVFAAISRAAPDLVVNTAAYTAVDRAEEEPDEAFAVNAEGPAHLGAACGEHGVPVVHLSTDYVFDGTKAGAYVETDPPAPLSVYGRSKRAGEERLAEATPLHLILRTARVHSPFGENFVRTMLRLGAENDTLSVVDDQIGSPTYAGHLADLLVALADGILGGFWPNPWGIYHAAGTGKDSWFGFAKVIFREAAKHGGPDPKLVPAPASAFPRPAARPANAWLDTGKLREGLGLALPPWQEGVAACVGRLYPARRSDPAERGIAAGRG